MEQYCRAGQASDDNIIGRMRMSCDNFAVHGIMTELKLRKSSLPVVVVTH